MSEEETTWTNTNAVAQSIALEQLEKDIDAWSRWLVSQRFRKWEATRETRGAAAVKCAEWGFWGIGIKTDHLTVAPDVWERLKRLPEAMPSEDGPSAIFGLPVYVVSDMPAGWWVRWEYDSPVDAGRVEERGAG